MAKIMAQFDAVTIRPVSYDEEAGTIVNIEYKQDGEVVFVVEGAPLGEGLDVSMKVEFDITSTSVKYQKPK